VITNIEKNLYNTYLRISRTSQNKPFSYRKDFSEMDDSSLLFLNRINNLLFKYPHISPEDYFLAPFKVYPNAEHFTLEYFAGMGGVNAYSLYMKQLQEMPPDSDEQLKFIRNSLRVIGSFCIKNGITLKEYPTHKTGITYDWMKQIKKHEISIYVLMEFQEISNIIKEVAEDEKELFLGEVGTYYWGYKSKYMQSEFAKQLVKEGISKINKIVNEKKD
jgi:hypothetical protein